MSSKPAGYSPAIGAAHGDEKAAGIQRLFCSVPKGCALEPFAPAAAIHARRATPVAIAIHAALEAMVPPTSAAEAAPHAGQEREPAIANFFMRTSVERSHKDERARRRNQ